MAVASPEQNWRRVRLNYLRQSYVINSKVSHKTTRKKYGQSNFNLQRNNGSNFKNNGNNIVRDFWTESVEIFGSKIPQ